MYRARWNYIFASVRSSRFLFISIVVSVAAFCITCLAIANSEQTSAADHEPSNWEGSVFETSVLTPVPASPGDLVISQIYGNGGTAGATYRNSYVEIFNRNTSPVLTHAYAIALGLGTSPIDRSIGASSSRGIVIQPGQHLLIRMGSGGSNGADLPQPD